MATMQSNESNTDDRERTENMVFENLMKQVENRIALCYAEQLCNNTE